jgi:hypothetical protein
MADDDLDALDSLDREASEFTKVSFSFSSVKSQTELYLI